MKLSLQIKPTLLKPNDRVIVKIGKDEWYTGTVVRLTKKTIKVVFDDGLESTVKAEDFKHIKPLLRRKRTRAALSDSQAKELITPMPVVPKTIQGHKIPRPTQKTVIVQMPVSEKPKASTTATNIQSLVFCPPDSAHQKFATTFKQMVAWIERVTEHYKFDESLVSKERKLGSVGLERSFSKPVGPTFVKYTRAAAELLAAFRASPLWRVQVTAGSTQFFSLDGSFHVAFYNSPTLSSTSPNARTVGLYLIVKPY